MKRTRSRPLSTWYAPRRDTYCRSFPISARWKRSLSKPSAKKREPDMIAWAIARQTVNEALRRRIMWVFLISGFALIALMPLFGYLAPKDSQTVLRSLGLAAILLAGLFITIVTCIYLIPAEIERRTIYTVLSKPVQRYEFVLGKFLGGFTVVALNVLAMGTVFLAMIWFSEGHSPGTEMYQGVLMTFFQMLLL